MVVVVVVVEVVVGAGTVVVVVGESGNVVVVVEESGKVVVEEVVVVVVVVVVVEGEQATNACPLNVTEAPTIWACRPKTVIFKRPLFFFKRKSKRSKGSVPFNSRRCS